MDKSISEAASKFLAMIVQAAPLCPECGRQADAMSAHMDIKETKVEFWCGKCDLTIIERRRI
jgi:ribosomal protein S27AE